MPFKKGDLKTKEWAKQGGRKGYEFEKEQLEKMIKIVSCDIALLEKIYSNKATKKDLEKLKLTTSRVMKYLDKLHATKKSDEIISENPIELVISDCIAKRYNLKNLQDNNN